MYDNTKLFSPSGSQTAMRPGSQRELPICSSPGTFLTNAKTCVAVHPHFLNVLFNVNLYICRCPDRGVWRKTSLSVRSRVETEEEEVVGVVVFLDLEASSTMAATMEEVKKTQLNLLPILISSSYHIMISPSSSYPAGGNNNPPCIGNRPSYNGGGGGGGSGYGK